MVDVFLYVLQGQHGLVHTVSGLWIRFVHYRRVFVSSLCPFCAINTRYSCKFRVYIGLNALENAPEHDVIIHFRNYEVVQTLQSVLAYESLAF